MDRNDIVAIAWSTVEEFRPETFPRQLGLVLTYVSTAATVIISFPRWIQRTQKSRSALRIQGCAKPRLSC